MIYIMKKDCSKTEREKSGEHIPSLGANFALNDIWLLLCLRKSEKREREKERERERARERERGKEREGEREW